jgi:hypothetical protein
MASKKKGGRKKSGRRKYSRSASKSVKSAMHRRKKGTLKRGKKGHGGKVKSRKQAIAIGLSEARKKGAKVPRKKKGRKTSRKKSSRKSSRKKSSRKRS